MHWLLFGQPERGKNWDKMIFQRKSFFVSIGEIAQV